MKQTNVIEATNLGKKYGKSWAVQDCSLTVPAGSITALVGPNGAGKSTLLKQIVGLDSSSTGELAVLGKPPSSSAEFISNIGYLAQSIPLYDHLTAAEHSALLEDMNTEWDEASVIDRLRELNIPADRAVGSLSGGQRTQVALALTLAKRPKLLILDEPVAALDPLAREEFLRILTQAVADSAGKLTVILSSHLIADLEKVCDYLIVLTAAHVRLVASVDDVLATHHLITGPARKAVGPRDYKVILETITERQVTRLVKLTGSKLKETGWHIEQPSLEEIIMAYMKQARQTGAVAKEADNV